MRRSAERRMTLGALGALAVLAGGAPKAAAKPAPAPRPWFRAEKVRCLSYLYADTQSAAYVPRVKQMGFNCALVQAAGTPIAKLEPLLQAADRARLRLILVDNWDNRRYLQSPAGANARRYVGADGNANPHMPCPADPEGWAAAIGQRADELARLRVHGHPSVCGLLFDVEDYSAVGDQSCGGQWYCYCDECWRHFLRDAGVADPGVTAGEREAWLSGRGLLARFRRDEDGAVASAMRSVRERLDRIAPDFLLASYPWLDLVPSGDPSQVQWDERFARGLGTAQSPFMLFAESTYIWGYDPYVEQRQADLAAQHLYFLAVTGFNLIPAERVWWPEQMTASAWWASRRSDGYWFFLGSWPLLDAPAGRPVSGVWGDRSAAWVRQFAAVNKLIASGRSAAKPLLPLAPLPDGVQLTDLSNPRHAPGTQMLDRRWSDIGLPWQGGELVMTGWPGDWLSFDGSIGTPDRYEISAWLTTGPDRPVARLEVDGKPVGDPVDLHAHVTTPGDKVTLGFADLGAGSHTLKLVALASRGAAGRCEIGLRAVSILRVGNPPTVWSVIGPFDNTGPDLPGYDAVYPPERGIDLAASYAGKAGATVHWRQVHAQPDGYLDLQPLFSERTDAVAYCLTYVYTPVDAEPTVLLGSDDGDKLFVNGQFVGGSARKRSAIRDEDAIRVHLRHGWNAVLCKVLQATGEWGLYLRIYDPAHELRYSLAPGL